MKARIQQLARGNFNERGPQIRLSQPQLSLEADRGSKAAGELTLESENQIEIRAMVFSSSRFMHVRESAVTGLKAVIHYEFDTSAFPVDHVEKGTITLVSNAGEIQIPYEVKISEPSCQSSAGPISDLDAFTELARRDWDEAAEIFTGQQFRDVFLKNRRLRQICQSLTGGDKDQVLEDFLCVTRHKKPVVLSVSQNIIETEDLKEVIRDRLVIEKDCWGWTNIRVRTEGDFLSVVRSEITGRDFLGSYYQLEYQIRPVRNRMARGAIILESFDQVIEIPVVCTRLPRRSERDMDRRELAASIVRYGRERTDWELQKSSRDRWLTEGQGALDGCLNNSRDDIFRVAEAEYLISVDRREDASLILDGINGQELRYRSAVEYCYYLYVNACCREDEHYTSYVRDNILFYAQGRLKNRWELTVMLARLQRLAPGGADHPRKIFSALRGQFSESIPGDAFYVEAARAVNLDPSVLRGPDGFEMSLFIWGCRHNALSREVIFRFADLAGRTKIFNRGFLAAMMEQCDTYESRQLLAAVVHMLILGNCRGQEYHKWYELGIESALRIPGLYEFFMSSLDMESDAPLPYAVVIYFQFDNQLPAAQRAYLYRYVLEHQDLFANIFDHYNAIIRAFTFARLEEGRIDRNLAVLYSHYLTKDALTRTTLQSLTPVLFRRRLTVKGSARPVRVIVACEEISDELYYPLTDGTAYVDIFLDDCQILFEDGDGNRHISGVEYDLEPLLDTGRYIRRCYEEVPDNPMVLLNRCDRALRYQMMDEDSIRVYRRTLALEQVSSHYRKTILKNLIDYYYDSYEGETLERYLLQIDFRLLGSRERGSVIEYFIQRNLFDQAWEAVQQYGYENLKIPRIMRLCSRMIRQEDYQRDTFLMGMAWYSFAGGRYDEVILKYLIEWYNGPAKNLYAVWKAAGDFEVPAFALEERLLCVMLFSRTMMDVSTPVFVDYYRQHADMKIVRAYLCSYSYLCLQGRMEMQQDAAHILEIELEQMDTGRDVCGLALLQYYAGPVRHKKQLQDQFCRMAADFLDRGIYMDFFRDFAGNALLPAELADLTCLTHITDPWKDVSVRWHRSGEEQIREMPMTRAAGGIFTAVFRLMPGESILCEVVEREEGSVRYLGENILKAQPPAVCGGRALLGQLADSAAAGREEDAGRQMLEWDRLDQLTDRLFSLEQEQTEHE